MKKLLDIVGTDRLLAAMKEAVITNKPVYIPVKVLKGFMKTPKIATAQNKFGAKFTSFPHDDGTKDEFYHKGYQTGNSQQVVVNGAFFVESGQLGKNVFGETTIEVKVMPNKKAFEAYVGFRFDPIADSTAEDRFDADTVSVAFVEPTGKKVKEVYEMNDVYVAVKSAK